MMGRDAIPAGNAIGGRDAIRINDGIDEENAIGRRNGTRAAGQRRGAAPDTPLDPDRSA